MTSLLSHKTVVALVNISVLLILFCFLGVHAITEEFTGQDDINNEAEGVCEGINKFKDYESKCYYVEAHKHTTCVTQGCIDYLHIFYCTLGAYPALGHTLLVLWLLILFYLLGDTASQYFCSSLDSLSRLLRLPPTIAGVTLLSLGNGAPDVFSSLVSFAGSGVADVGLSSVLGGALFVSSVVFGIISIVVASQGIVINCASFIRDICFLLLILGSLLAIMITGEIAIWGSIAFCSMYVVYVLIVWAGHYRNTNPPELIKTPLLENSDVEDPMMVNIKIEDRLVLQPKVRHCYNWKWLFSIVKLPLDMPRRLTIPDVSEKSWCKTYAIASVGLSPLLLATLWNSLKGEMSSSIDKVPSCIAAVLVGIVLGLIAWKTTEKAHPPKMCLFPWLAWGFLMSVIWAYMIARELVSLLVSIGNILGISPVVLGLTVLAWGNSLGDLIANVALAIRNGSDGVEIAISGCYAGPIFNTLVGLGLSLVLAAGASHPIPLAIPQDSSLFETVWFLMGSLFWALVVLPLRGMRLDRVLGIGLLVIYLSFLCLRLSKSLELVQFVAQSVCMSGNGFQFM